MNYVLDAGPMIAFLDDEPGAAVVEQVLTEPGSTCYAHIFNLTENPFVLSLSKHERARGVQLVFYRMDCNLV